MLDLICLLLIQCTYIYGSFLAIHIFHFDLYNDNPQVLSIEIFLCFLFCFFFIPFYCQTNKTKQTNKASKATKQKKKKKTKKRLITHLFRFYLRHQ